LCDPLILISCAIVYVGLFKNYPSHETLGTIVFKEPKMSISIRAPPGKFFLFNVLRGAVKFQEESATKRRYYTGTVTGLTSSAGCLDCPAGV
jgi:hypothetical protein